MSVSRTFPSFLKHGGRRRPASGTRKLRIPVVGALVLVLSVPAGLTPLAAAADPLGRPDVPAPRVSKVKTVSALGAKEARERAAKNRATNNKQAARARSDHAAYWPKASHSTQKISGKPVTSTVSVTTPRPTKAAARNGKPAATAAGTATVNVLDQKAARSAGITGVVFTATAESPGTAGITVDGATEGPLAHQARLPARPLARRVVEGRAEATLTNVRGGPVKTSQRTRSGTIKQ